MQIPTKEVREGKHNNEIVWICDYRRDDLSIKASRVVPPTKSKIMDDSMTKKTVYYSKSFFAPLKKNGEPSSKAIMAVDNTGYRYREGNELYVFDNEDECNKKWNELLAEVVERMDRLIANNPLIKERQELIDRIA